ncbi:MAG: hypothetical protein LBC08_00570 [Campylobacteraceae bacterium]|jgi:hypothetical protein|nr:hypothetical protein [Campylobacteraceae bacterium]
MENHSKLGIASFAVSIINITSIFVLHVAGVNLQFSIIGLFYFIFVGVGFGLGVNVFRAKNKKKIFGILGMVFSIAAFFALLVVTT